MTIAGFTDQELADLARQKGASEESVQKWLASMARNSTLGVEVTRTAGTSGVAEMASVLRGIEDIKAGRWTALKPDRGRTGQKRASTARRSVDRHVFTLPWALLVSDNLHVGPNANRVKWRTYRDRRDAMHAAFAVQAQGAPLSGHCQLTVTFYPPNFRRRDVSNFLKAMGDALQGVAYYNDDQLVQYVYGRQQPDRENPRAEIEVSRHERRDG